MDRKTVSSNQFSLSKASQIMQTAGHKTDPQSNCSFLCDVCGKQFRTSSFKRHMTLHKTDLDVRRRYKCDICENQFTRNSDMKKHVKTLHETDPDLRQTFKCDVCGNQFTKNSALKRHITSVHGTNPDLRRHFGCDVCGNKFTYKHNLKNHMKLHKTDLDLRRTFKCDICGCHFTRKYLLNKHMTTFHKQDPDIRCSTESDACKKQFVRNDDLETHKSNLESVTDFRHPSMLDIYDGAFTEEYGLSSSGVINECNPEYSSDLNERFEESDLKLTSMLLKTSSNLPVLDAICEEILGPMDLDAPTVAQCTSSDLEYSFVGDAHEQ